MSSYCLRVFWLSFFIIILIEKSFGCAYLFCFCHFVMKCVISWLFTFKPALIPILTKLFIEVLDFFSSYLRIMEKPRTGFERVGFKSSTFQSVER